MGRPKKDSTPICFLCERQIADDLDLYCKTTQLTKTAAIERMLRFYLQPWKKELEKNGRRFIAESDSGQDEE